jgi:hypothetical protein
VGAILPKQSRRIIMRNNKYRAFFTVTQVTTPKGLLVVQDYYPSKGTPDKKWREYVIHLAAIIGGESLAFTTPEARNTWVQAQGAPVQQPLPY